MAAIGLALAAGGDRLAGAAVSMHGKRGQTLCAPGLRRTVLAAGALIACLAPAAAQQEMPAEIIAVQIRKQGFACAEAQSAVRDREASAPNATVWLLRCKNATYRVRLTPDLAAQVERVE